MASRSIKFMRALLLVELLIAATRPVRALEIDVSMNELKFELNEEFLFNTEPCPIPTMHIDFVFPDGVERLLSRSHIVDLHGSRKWLRAMSGKVESDIDSLSGNVRAMKEKQAQSKEAKANSKWLRQWQKEFKKKQYELIKKGEGMSSCIIWNINKRRICCQNYLDKEQAFGDLWQFKHTFCMGLVKVFVDTLLKTGVLLAQDDEEKLEDELSKVLAMMAKKRADRKTSVSLTPIYGIGIDKVVPDNDRHPLTDEEKERYTEEAKLLKFLVAMKQIEYLFLIEKDSYVNDGHKAVYSTFMHAFQACNKRKRAAISFHTAETRWISCGPLVFGDFVAGYCADLAALDPNAQELGRKPILKWESGAYEHLHDLLDPENIDTGDAEGDNDGNSQRAVVESRRYSDLRRAVRGKYRDVDLFQVQLVRADSSCNDADLAHACYAMCCDSGYRMSYYCRTQGLRCIG